MRYPPTNVNLSVTAQIGYVERTNSLHTIDEFLVSNLQFLHFIETDEYQSVVDPFS
jgi:hypothetical protein